MTSRRDLEQQVEARAAGRCEYYRMHQSLQGATFHVEHVVPIQSDIHGNLPNARSRFRIGESSTCALSASNS